VKDIIEFQLTLCDGKYTYRRFAGGGQDALRHGESWRDLTGDNLILFMAFKVEELEAEVAGLKQHALKAKLESCEAALASQTRRLDEALAASESLRSALAEADAALYRHLTIFLSAHEPDDSGFAEAWADLERVKNRNGGNPPKGGAK